MVAIADPALIPVTVAEEPLTLTEAALELVFEVRE
jgi:hypothetical protein